MSRFSLTNKKTFAKDFIEAWRLTRRRDKTQDVREIYAREPRARGSKLLVFEMRNADCGHRVHQERIESGRAS